MSPFSLSAPKLHWASCGKLQDDNLLNCWKPRTGNQQRSRLSGTFRDHPRHGSRMTIRSSRHPSWVKIWSDTRRNVSKQKECGFRLNLVASSGNASRITSLIAGNTLFVRPICSQAVAIQKVQRLSRKGVGASAPKWEASRNGR